MSTAPIKIGILLDHGGPESPMMGEVRRVADDAVARGRLDRPVSFVTEATEGLPRGTAAAVTAGFWRLIEQDVLAILGPSITDNGLIATDLADQAEVACVNWTGSDRTRSEWMFHYQIGSLEEEPFLIVERCLAEGTQKVVLVQDRSPIGARYGAYFEEAANRRGLQILAKTLISPVAEDLGETVADLRRYEADGLVYLGLGMSAGAVGRALAATEWRPPVVTNSALMFGWADPALRTIWDGWTYVDAWSERNPRLRDLIAVDPARQGMSPMMFAAGDDLGRLLVEALAGTEQLTQAAIKESFERVKCLPASLGGPDTSMSFGHWDRAALKGEFLVLRSWKNGKSVEVTRP